MSANKVTEKLLKEMGKHDFILVNFANGDMVGHTGILKAGIKAVETVDRCLGQLLEEAKDYAILVTADHGNCEDMRKTGKSNTAHTLNKVPFVLVSEKHKNKKLKEGGLSNIAPTVLKLMKIKKPREMKNSLF